MATSDATYTKMLLTPEARDVWDKVLEMRGLKFKAGIKTSVEYEAGKFMAIYEREDGGGGVGEQISLPDLDELWALAKEKGAKTRQALAIRFSYDPAIDYVEYSQPDSYVWVVLAGFSVLAGLVQFLVGRDWDAEKGAWRE